MILRIFLCARGWSIKLAKNWDTEKSPTFPHSVNECHKIDTSSRVRKTEHMRSRQNLPVRSKVVSKPWNRMVYWTVTTSCTVQQIVSVLLRRTFYKMLIKRPIFYACLFITRPWNVLLRKKKPWGPWDKKKIKLLNSGARSGAPWVRKFGYPREILVVRWLYVHPPVCPHHTFLHCVEPAACV